MYDFNIFFYVYFDSVNESVTSVISDSSFILLMFSFIKFINEIKQKSYSIQYSDMNTHMVSMSLIFAEDRG